MTEQWASDLRRLGSGEYVDVTEAPFVVGQVVAVQHEGIGRVVRWDEGSVYVTIESDGVTVAAAYEQVEL
jgi:hypothetical protein